MQLQTQLLPNRFLASLPKPFPYCPQKIRHQNPNQTFTVSCKSFNNYRTNNRIKAQSKKKDNVWSVDNEIAAKDVSNKKKSNNSKDRRKRGRRVVKKKKKDGLVMASAAMLMEVETVLQTQEPIIKPAWNTFASSLSGIWKGVGAVFSPFTAEMEPIGVGSKNENLYDCYTLSRIEWSQYDGQFPKITRKTNWVTLNPFGEILEHVNGKSDDITVNQDKNLPYHGSFDFEKSEVLEEDSMSAEPGLVFFEDGSYSRGPVEIPVGEHDESKYFLSPTFKFEQCLVKGCHKRLRIVHTIMFNEGGSDIQIVRVAVYEEQWVCPVSLYDGSNDQVDIKPISQRKRTQPSDLAGSWKVFEISATPIFEEDPLTTIEQDTGPPYVFLCMETLKKRSLPDNATYFGEEEMLDMNDVTVLWLPGGITGYVDVKEDGTLCIGVGWYSDEGINLVMERDYGMDGKLKEVRSKTEVKRMWSDPAST